MTSTESSEERLDGPQTKPTLDEEQTSREFYEEWEQGQRESGEHILRGGPR
jgi:hypothetical protein